MSPEDQERWDDIKRTFKQNVKMRGIGSDDKVGQVIATLSTFSDGLAAIQKAVSQGVMTLAAKETRDQESPQLMAEAGKLNTSLESLAARLSENLAAMLQLAGRPIQVDMPEIVLPDIKMPDFTIPPIEMQWPENMPTAPSRRSQRASKCDKSMIPATTVDSGDDADDQPMPDRITVVNKLPRTVMNVMESQFRLMQDWIKPLSEGSRLQRAEFDELRKTVQECLRNYEALLGRLEAAKKK